MKTKLSKPPVLAFIVADALVCVLAVYVWAVHRNKLSLCARPVAQCVMAMLVVLTLGQGSHAANYLSALAVAVHLTLIQHPQTFAVFQIATLLNMYRTLHAEHVDLWHRGTAMTMYAYMLLAHLDSRSQNTLRLLTGKFMYKQEWQLIKLNRIREIVFDDIWELPERFRLKAICGEFTYDVNQPLFLIRAIARMIWRPLLPLCIVQMLVQSLSVVEVVLESRVLHCLDSASEYAWYHGYVAALALMCLRSADTQCTRLKDYINSEIDRAFSAVELEIFRLPLSVKLRATRTTYSFEGYVQQLIYDLKGVQSLLSRMFGILAAFWPVYYRVGGLAFVPIAVVVGITLIDRSFGALFGRKHEWTTRSKHHYRYDGRVDEIFDGAKSIKLFGWEQMYLDPNLQIKDLDEDRKPWFAFIVRFAWTAIELISMLASNISSYVVIHYHTLNATAATAKSFTNANMHELNSHTETLRHNVQWIFYIMRRMSSIFSNNIIIEKRLKCQLANTLPQSCVVPTGIAPSVAMNKCSFKWHTTDTKPVLANVTLGVSNGELVAVVGKTGSGKTSLLLSICGEVEMDAGSGQIVGRIGYLEQSPWIMNDTLRANVLFGREYDSAFFKKVVHACALADDIAQWPDGDLTVIGDRGINISGGQRARLALARTLYLQADVYVLDDPLSAVDAHVKRHIMEHVILDTGMLGGKLRIVSTHLEHILPFASQIVRLDDHTATVTTQVPQKYQPVNAATHLSDDEASVSSSATAVGDTGLPSPPASPVKPKQNDDDKPVERKWSNWENAVYVYKLCGLWLVAGIVLSGFIRPISEFILNSLELTALKDNSNTSFDRGALLWYLQLRMASSLSESFINYAEMTANMLIAERYLESSVKQTFIQSLLFAPMSFFDSTTRQEVSSVYNNGARVVSSRIPNFLMHELAYVLRIFLSIYHVARSTPYLLIFVPLVGWATEKRDCLIEPALTRLRKIDRSMKISRDRTSHVIAGGKRMIRLFGVESYFTNRYIEDHDESQRLRAPLSALCTLTYSACIVIYSIGDMIVSMLLLLQSQISDFKTTSSEYITCQRLLRTLVVDTTRVVNFPSRVQTFSDSIDLYRQFTLIEPEAPYIVENSRPLTNWPEHGKIEFRDFSMQYRDDLGAVLDNINLVINPGEKIGIVGRTGAGKSSLAKVLFRLVNTGISGSIYIDGQDISTIGLGDLRPRLGIIPQESTIFSGSYKQNLDPLREFSMEEIWAALLKCNIAERVSPKTNRNSTDRNVVDNAFYKEELAEAEERWSSASWSVRVLLLLFMKWPKPTVRRWNIQPHGINRYCSSSSFSNGQQQLFSLCRLLLRKRRIIILDEATANVDLDTDKNIQRLIRDEFGDCTVLTIAHRLETVMNSDRIVVMDKGKVVEVGPPNELIAKGGMFAELVQTSSFGT
ncbi:Multidrug resistance-associated protein 1 [Coemansia sp. RSA 720]|nr:Multidrug resistance-associated protein 1 [Coemansia sp. RSA 720]